MEGHLAEISLAGVYLIVSLPLLHEGVTSRTHRWNRKMEVPCQDGNEVNESLSTFQYTVGNVNAFFRSFSWTERSIVI